MAKQPDTAPRGKRGKKRECNVHSTNVYVLICIYTIKCDSLMVI